MEWKEHKLLAAAHAFIDFAKLGSLICKNQVMRPILQLYQGTELMYMKCLTQHLIQSKYSITDSLK